MKQDRTVKVLLAVIALGLWMHLLTTWLRPAVTAKAATTDYGSMIYSKLGDISDSVDAIKNGGNGCLNTKICD